MAKFELDEGELELARAAVTDVTRAQKRATAPHARLVLTNQRVVVIVEPGAGAGWSMFGALGALFGQLFGRATTETKIPHQISRREFGDAEATSKRELKVRSKGTGYAMTWFEVEIKDPDSWVDRLQRWGSGELVEPLPSAKVVT